MFYLRLQPNVKRGKAPYHTVAWYVSYQPKAKFVRSSSVWVLYMRVVQFFTITEKLSYIMCHCYIITSCSLRGNQFLLLLRSVLIWRIPTSTITCIDVPYDLMLAPF